MKSECNDCAYISEDGKVCQESHDPLVVHGKCYYRTESASKAEAQPQTTNTDIAPCIECEHHNKTYNSKLCKSCSHFYDSNFAQRHA